MPSWQSMLLSSAVPAISGRVILAHDLAEGGRAAPVIALAKRHIRRRSQVAIGLLDMAVVRGPQADVPRPDFRTKKALTVGAALLPSATGAASPPPPAARYEDARSCDTSNGRKRQLLRAWPKTPRMLRCRMPNNDRKQDLCNNAANMERTDMRQTAECVGAAQSPPLAGHDPLCNRLAAACTLSMSAPDTICLATPSPCAAMPCTCLVV